MMTNINIKTDQEVKTKAEILFAELGLNMTTAINVFLKQAIYENRIPFSIYREGRPNAESRKALEEADSEAFLSDKFSDMEALKKGLKN